MRKKEAPMDTTIDRPHAHMRPSVAALGNVIVDGARKIELPPLLQRGQRSYYAEISTCQLDEQSLLIEQLIGFALDTLGARHLDVCVRPTERRAALSTSATAGSIVAVARKEYQPQ